MFKYSNNITDSIKKGHVGPVFNAQFSPDNLLIVSAGQDSKAKLWTAQGEWKQDFLHGGPIRQAVFSPDGQMIATASDDNTVIIWSSMGARIALLQHSSDIKAIKFSEDSKLLATSSDRTVNLWSVGPQKDMVQRLWEKKDHQSTVTAIDINQKIIVSGGEDGQVKIWTIDGVPITAPVQHDEVVVDIKISPDGNYIATASYDDTIKLAHYDQQTHQIRPINKSFKHGSDVNAVVFSPDGKFLASASEDQTVRIWNVEGEDESPVIILDDPSLSDGRSKESNKVKTKSHEGWVRTLAFNSNSKILVSGSNDHTVKLWTTENGDWSDGKLLKPLEAHNDEINSVGFSPDDQTVVSSSNDGTVKLWNINDGQVVSLDSESPSNRQDHNCDQNYREICVSDKRREVRVIDISNDGRTFITGTDKGEVRKFSLDQISRDPISFNLDQQSRVVDAKISPNGQFIASVSDNTIHLFHQDGRSIREINEHVDTVNAIEFSPDSRLLVSASDDNKIGLWNVADGRGSVQESHEDWVRDIAFSPKGKPICISQ